LGEQAFAERTGGAGQQIGRYLTINGDDTTRRSSTASPGEDQTQHNPSSIQQAIAAYSAGHRWTEANAEAARG
jgi:hypothetical protein